MADGILFEADTYTCTRLPSDTFSIIWTIDQFPRFLKADYKAVESSMFHPLGPGDPAFQLVCRRRPGERDFTLQLRVAERAETSVKFMTARLFLLDRSSEGDHRISAEINVNPERLMPPIEDAAEDDRSDVLASFVVENPAEFEEFFHRDEVATVRCELNFFSSPLPYGITTKIEGYRHYSQLIDDLHQIYEKHEFSDGVLAVGDEEFFISRAVLAARSSVFKAMFTCGLKEATEGRVEIADFSADVVRRLLEYVYTGRISGELDVETALSLLEAGNKYDVEGVKNLAQESLVGRIEVENVCELLVHADIYGAELLKQQCISFVALNRSKIIRTDGWRALSDPAHHSLMLQLIETTKDLQI
ncbi:Speckle-type POZ protein B-like protein [Aphelenchoides fujianensis]|nr:Speckle-type POZ protein B-like protein [Aphelenchoides fujianensis]